jgi:hypothetical protein
VPRASGGVVFLQELCVNLGFFTSLNTLSQILRASLSQANGTFHGGVPNNLSRSITGKLHTQFFGWEPTTSVFWVLIPWTIVAGATVHVVLAVIARHTADPMPEDDFDPSDTMQLVSASAAGGLSSVFAGVEMTPKRRWMCPSPLGSLKAWNAP